MNTPFPKTNRESTAALHQASDDAVSGADRAIDSTRQYANSALDKAQNKVHGLRDQIDPMIDMLTNKAQHLARQSYDMANEARHRAQHGLQQAGTATSRYVAEQPMRSVLIAAAVGAGIALLIAAARHRDDSIRY